MGIPEILFFVLLGLLAIPYLVYPVMLKVTSTVLPRRWKTEEITPKVTLVIPAYNEEAFITEKISNSLSLDYPGDLLEVLVISDGSTDRTDELVRNSSIKLIRFEENRGKCAAINRALDEATGEIIVLTDASSILEPDALKALVAPFADELVGATCGMLVPVGREGVETYRSFENSLRKMESLRGSSVGATGALYAFRKVLADKLEEDTVLDDVVLPMRIVGKGYRLLFIPEARAIDTEGTAMGREFRRKARTLGGNWQAFFRLKKLFIPFYRGTMLGLIAHRVLRVLSPLLLLGVAAITVLLIFEKVGTFYIAAGALQGACYLAAIVGGIFSIRGILGWPWTFVVFQAAALWGLVLFVFGRLTREWRKTAENRTSRS